MTRAVLRRVHRWIGLILTLPLILLSATGLIMSADPFAASVFSIPSANGLLTRPDATRTADVASVLDAARAAVPADLAPVRWRVRPDGNVAVDFAAAGQMRPGVQAPGVQVPVVQVPVVQVSVDTSTNRIIAERQNPDGFYRWIHSLHETLLMGQAGRTIVGCIGISLLLLGLSGIPLWWPRRGRWGAGFTVARGAAGWTLQRQLHGAGGIWMMVLLLLQSVSGMTMAFPQAAHALFGAPTVRGGRTEIAANPSRAMTIGAAAARAAMPGAVLLDLRLMPGRPIMAILLPEGRWQGSPAAMVTMDPVNGRVLSVHDPRTDPAGSATLDWLRAFHEGSAAGPAGRAVMCLFGLLLPLLPVTGVAMWVLRRRRRRRPLRLNGVATEAAE